MSRLTGLGSVIVLGLLLAGCGTTAPSTVAGTWAGTLTDVGVGAGTLQFVLTQSGSTLNGTYTSKFAIASVSLTGTISGTLNGSTVTALLTPTNPAACQQNITATVSGSSMNGTYTLACSSPEGGTFSLQLQ
jgi:hypothetical protein